MECLYKVDLLTCIFEYNTKYDCDSSKDIDELIAM